MFPQLIWNHLRLLELKSQVLWKSGSEICFRHFSGKRKVHKPKEWQLKKLLTKEKDKSNLIKESAREIDPNLIKSGLVIERLSDKLMVELRPSDITPTITVDNATKQRILCSQKSYLSDIRIVAGDIVDMTLQTDVGSTGGWVVGLHDRRNVLQRPSVNSSQHKLAMKPIASNIDQLIVVSAVEPKVPTSVLDRYIVAAHYYDIPEIVLTVNKHDLEGSEQLVRNMEFYNKLGYKVITSSTTSDNGLQSLTDILSNKTSVFVGQSGVGKSSLINCILPEANIKTGGLVNRGKSGAHTTSNAKLYHLPGGGSIIDSPGIRELGTWHMDRRSVLDGFVEIREHAQHCKFKNCQHSEAESHDCGVRSAIDSGEVHPDRFLSYLNMIKT